MYLNIISLFIHSFITIIYFYTNFLHPLIKKANKHFTYTGVLIFNVRFSGEGGTGRRGRYRAEREVQGG